MFWLLTDDTSTILWRFGSNYHFPLLYPDWGFGNIVYFKRIRANGFYDYTHGKNLYSGNKFLFRTAGAELFFDTKWWNEAEVTFGLRYSRLLDDDLFGEIGKNRWELILPVNLLKQ